MCVALTVFETPRLSDADVAYFATSYSPIQSLMFELSESCKSSVLFFYELSHEEGNGPGLRAFLNRSSVFMERPSSKEPEHGTMSPRLIFKDDVNYYT